MNGFLFFAVMSVMPALDGSTTSSTSALPPKIVIEPAGAARLPKGQKFTYQPDASPETPQTARHCIPGKIVMIPDGREGEVTSYTDGICRVLAYGEAYVSLWTDEMVEPVYPQQLQRHNFGH